MTRTIETDPNVAYSQEQVDRHQRLIRPQIVKQSRFPGWRHMTAAQRYNARMDEIFEQAKARGDWPRSDTER
jgi:hypothetical protein